MVKSLDVLRKVLLLDALTCLATGLALLSGAGLLAAPLGLPAALLRYAGLLLLPFAALLVSTARRTTADRGPSRAQLWTIVVLNAVWVVYSVLLLLSGWVEPTALGQAFVIGQAVVVALLCELEYAGLRVLPGVPDASVRPG